MLGLRSLRKEIAETERDAERHRRRLHASRDRLETGLRRTLSSPTALGTSFSVGVAAELIVPGAGSKARAVIRTLVGAPFLAAVEDFVDEGLSGGR